ncbi:MAG: (2Fe-2S)-binding protein [Firmicutes bacterium]|mgnify:CR=1 FL=1|nr:(2Fe-2S)-binding protein [Bacillota bacterium]
MKKRIELTINGEHYEFNVEPWRTLVEVIREEAGLTGAKESCGTGECGNCLVILDGKPVNSCLVLAVDANGKDILTIEGVAEGEKLHPLQKAFVDHGAIQCGFCTPGMILAAKSFLEKNPKPTRMETKEAMEGVLCRCTGYVRILDAVLAASQEMMQENKTATKGGK